MSNANKLKIEQILQINSPNSFGTYLGSYNFDTKKEKKKKKNKKKNVPSSTSPNAK